MAEDEEDLQRIYQWIDEIPLTRPKRNISRDFADGVLVAEVVAHYYPRMVELHNYPPANSFAQKIYNWQTLTKKVFKKVGLAMAKPEMEALSNAEPGAVEQLLKKLQVALAKYNLRKKQQAAAGIDGSPGGHSPGQREGGGPQVPSERASAHALAAGADPLLVLQERDQTVDELVETISILEIKVTKLEQLVRLKESKIQTLGLRLQQYEANSAAAIAAQAQTQEQQRYDY